MHFYLFHVERWSIEKIEFNLFGIFKTNFEDFWLKKFRIHLICTSSTSLNSYVIKFQINIATMSANSICPTYFSSELDNTIHKTIKNKNHITKITKANINSLTSRYQKNSALSHVNTPTQLSKHEWKLDHFNYKSHKKLT